LDYWPFYFVIEKILNQEKIANGQLNVQENPNNFRPFLKSVEDFLFFTDLQPDHIENFANKLKAEKEFSEKVLNSLLTHLRKKCYAGVDDLFDSGDSTEPSN
jgi:hypothetical protein